MPSTFSQVLKTLSGSREGVLSSADTFPFLDVDQLTNELRLVERGTEDGSAEYPKSESAAEPAAEADVRSEIGRRAAVAVRDYRLQEDLYVGRIRRGLLAAELRTSIEAAGERALSDFRVQATDDLSHLDQMQKEVVGRQAEFDLFRKKHRLERLARLPKATALRRLLLVLLVLVENLRVQHQFEDDLAGFFLRERLQRKPCVAKRGWVERVQVFEIPMEASRQPGQ